MDVVACTRHSQDQVNQNSIIDGEELMKSHSYSGSYSKMVVDVAGGSVSLRDVVPGRLPMIQ